MAAVFCCAQTQNNFQPATTNVWGAAYPRVDGGGRAEFRVKAPDASKVQVNFWGAAKLDMVRRRTDSGMRLPLHWFRVSTITL
jgi:1,4-alpha-glucan branching enzyme